MRPMRAPLLSSVGFGGGTPSSLLFLLSSSVGFGDGRSANGEGRGGEEGRGEGLLSSPRLASMAEGRQTDIQSRRNGLAWRLACVVVGHQNVFGIAIGNNHIALHELCHSILFDRVELICYPKAAFKVFMYVGVTSHTSYHRCSLSGCCFALIPCLVTAPVGHMGY